MSITTRCRRCGQEFAADTRAIVAGVWRLCPACRNPSPPGATTGPSPDPRPAVPSAGVA